MRIPDGSCLLQEHCQVGSVRIEEVTAPSQQATDTHSILQQLVATHRAIAFFDLSADGTLTSVLIVVQRFPIKPFLTAVSRLAMPEIPTIEEQDTLT